MGIKWALNHMTTPNLGLEAFLDLAASLDCVGVELRNDIARPLFDGMPPAHAGQLVQGKGLRLVGLSQVYPFNAWTPEISDQVARLIDTAIAAGAETISLIPRNDGQGTAANERGDNLIRAMSEILPMLQKTGLTALIEPLGFLRSSLRNKTELVKAINAINGRTHFKLVHDTFHHTLAGGGEMYPEYTGMVHVSGVIDPKLGFGDMEDEHRVLVDERDRLGNVAQISELRSVGYDGPVSYECFAPEVHAITDPFGAIQESMRYISERVG